MNSLRLIPIYVSVLTGYMIPGSMMSIRIRSPVPHASMLPMYIMLIVVLISEGVTGLVGSPIGSLVRKCPMRRCASFPYRSRLNSTM